MNCKATNLHSSHRQEPRPQGVTPQKQTAGEDSLTHSIRYQERCGFCLVPSSATHTVRGGGANNVSDGGEKNTWRKLADSL